LLTKSLFIRHPPILLTPLLDFQTLSTMSLF
jgi:hypothetical protein